MGRIASNKESIIAVTSVSLAFLDTLLMNVYARPIAASAWSGVSATAIGLSFVVDMIYAVIFFYGHTRAGLKCAFLIAGASLLAGITLTGVWLATSSNVAMVVGFQLANVGRTISEILVILTLSVLKPRACALCVGTALVCSNAINACFSLLPSYIGLIVFLVLPFMYLVISLPSVRTILEKVPGTDEPISGLTVTEPHSFVQPFHVLFLALFVFRTAYGLSISFYAVDESLIQTLFTAALPCIALIVIVCKRNDCFGDFLYRFSTLLIVGGLLLALAFPPRGENMLPFALLVSGSDCFRLLGIYFMAQIGHRNPLSAPFVISWSLTALNAGALVGFVAGSYMGLTSNSFSICMASVIFLFVAFNIISMHGASFDGTVRTMVPIPSQATSPERIPEIEKTLQERCLLLAEKQGLTPREREVMELLARGRSVPYIQDALSVSHNTVRTHVRHIYQKLGIHSQQELISMADTSKHRQ